MQGIWGKENFCYMYMHLFSFSYLSLTLQKINIEVTEKVSVIKNTNYSFCYEEHKLYLGLHKWVPQVRNTNSFNHYLADFL